MNNRLKALLITILPLFIILSVDQTLAATVIQPDSVSFSNKMTKGVDSGTNGADSTAIGRNIITNGPNSIAVGRDLIINGVDSALFGRGFGTSNRLISNTSYSFMVGYMSSATDNMPEFFVKDGAVGIGTDSPTQRLHVAGINPRILVESTTPSNPEINFKSAGSVNWALYKENNTGDLRFYQSGDKVTIENASGNVGIGTTDPGKKLYVNGSAGGTQAWNASDEREKTQIAPIENALAHILELRGISYRWKRGDEKESQGFDNKTHFGVIAQEVEAVYPELVDHPGITEKRKHVEYNGLIGVLIEAVKELKAQNEKQQAEIEKLRVMISEVNG